MSSVGKKYSWLLSENNSSCQGVQTFIQMYYEIFKCMEKTGGTEWLAELIWVDIEQTEKRLEGRLTTWSSDWLCGLCEWML